MCIKTINLFYRGVVFMKVVKMILTFALPMIILYLLNNEVIGFSPIK